MYKFMTQEQIKKELGKYFDNEIVIEDISSKATENGLTGFMLKDILDSNALPH